MRGHLRDDFVGVKPSELDEDERIDPEKEENGLWHMEIAPVAVYI